MHPSAMSRWTAAVADRLPLSAPAGIGVYAQVLIDAKARFGAVPGEGAAAGLVDEAVEDR